MEGCVYMCVCVSVMVLLPLSHEVSWRRGWQRDIRHLCGPLKQCPHRQCPINPGSVCLTQPAAWLKKSEALLEWLLVPDTDSRQHQRKRHCCLIPDLLYNLCSAVCQKYCTALSMPEAIKRDWPRWAWSSSLTLVSPTTKAPPRMDFTLNTIKRRRKGAEGWRGKLWEDLWPSC